MTSSALAATTKLNNGILMPSLQLGVYNMNTRETTQAVQWALDAGYRGFDTAQMYHNEAATGAAINSYLQSHASSGLTRADIWYTTKLLTNSTYSAATSSIAHSVKVSGLGYVDLFLLHAPYGGPRARAEAWRAVSDAVRAGTVRAGGVSNFSERHIEQLLASGPDVLPPAVNQVEIHPFNTRADLAKFCQARGIAVQAFCPLTRAEKLRDPRMAVLARKYKCTPAQLCVRWSRQHGYIPLPKSANKGRLVENAAIDGFEISKEDMEQMDGFDEGYVLDWDPYDAP